jgi:hypothetical protein
MSRRLLAFMAAAGVIVGAFVVAGGRTVALANAPQRAATGQMRAAHINTGHGIRTLPTLSGGVVDTASAGTPSSAAAAQGHGSGGGVGVSTGGLGCGQRNTSGSAFGNVRVNQDCTFRVQAVEGIAFNPTSPSNLIAGMNDERQGYNLMAFGYSFDNGHTWGDGPPPFYQKINDPSQELPTGGDPNQHTISGDPGNGFTYDGGSDPMLAFDLSGRAFFGGVIFDRFAGNGSAVVVSESPPGAGGSFYYTPTTFSRHFVIVEDNTLGVFHDKPFLAVDNGRSSSKQGNVYVTWTVFKMDPNTGAYFESPIYGSMSTDHGLTWSTPEQISGSSSTLCFFGNLFNSSLNPHSCNFDQGSDPMVLPNGQLEVIFNNGNTPQGNPNGQQLGVHCNPSGSSPAGSAHLNCGSPTKVGDDIIVNEPACDFGRGPEECIPGSFVRTDDFPRIGMNQGNGNLYATWQDFRGGEFDIQLSRSTDGGVTWTPASSPVNPDTGIDHYEASIGVVCNGPLASGNPMCPNSNGGGGGNTQSTASDGSRQLCPNATAAIAAQRRPNPEDNVAVSYYRTCQIPGESAGGVFTPSTSGVQAENSDYTLVGGENLETPYHGHPVSPTFSPPNGTRQTGFMGDYSGITLVGSTAHPIWDDPRNNVSPALRDPDQPVVNDQDIYTTATGVPGL